MNNIANKNNVRKQFSTILSGLVIIQLINFLFSLLLPKYFTPDAYAEFGIFTSILFIIIEIINAKFDIAVMLGKDKTEVQEIINAAFSIATIQTAILLLLVAVVLAVVNFIPKVYILLPACCLFYGIHQPILVYLNKMENYMSINTFRIIQVLITACITLAMGIMQLQHALIYGFSIGLLISTLYTLKFTQPKFSISELKKMYNTYPQFPKYGTWSALLNNISRNSIPLLLSLFFTPKWIGLYTYATRLLNAPTGMFSSAIGQIYFKKASILKNEVLKKETKKLVSSIFLLSIIPTCIILFFGKDIFSFFFNATWAKAGIVAQYLILWYLLGVITSPISILLDLKNKLKFELLYNAILLTVRILSVTVGGMLGDFYLSILLFAASGVVMNFILLYYIFTYILPND